MAVGTRGEALVIAWLRNSPKASTDRQQTLFGTRIAGAGRRTSQPLLYN